MATWRAGCQCKVYCKSQKKWYNDGRVETIGSNWIGVRFDCNKRFKKLKQTSKYVLPTITSWQLGSLCAIYSKSEKKWYEDGEIDDKGINWVNVRFDCNKKYKKVQMVSNHIMPISTENDKLRIRSDCLIYSGSMWCNGVIISVWSDNKRGEWLMVQYYDQHNKLNKREIRRHSKGIQYIHYASINSAQLIRNGVDRQTNPYFPWIKMHDAPLYNNNVNIIQINDKEFIMTATSGIYKFNATSKEWTLFCDTDYNDNMAMMAFDQITSKLYFWNGTHHGGSMEIVDIKSWKTTLSPILYPHYGVNRRSYLVNTQNDIHIIGHIHHLIFKKHNESFQSVTNINRDWRHGHVSFALYLSSKESIVIYKERFLIYSLRYKSWKPMNIFNPRSVTKYFDAALTKNEKHIIMIPTKTSSSFTIWILDICEDDYILRESKIKLPDYFKNAFMFRGIIETVNEIDEQMLIFGYIRDLYKKNIFDYDTIIPTDIIRLIIAYFNNAMEWIHILQQTREDKKKQQHFMIPLQMILYGT